MILIISIDFDHTTTQVINWLVKSGEPFLRINENDYLSDLEILDMDVKIVIGNHSFKLSEVTACWYRRGQLKSLNTSLILCDNEFSAVEVAQLNRFKQREMTKCLEYIYARLSSLSNSIGDFFNTDINKLNALHLAQSVGLNIPRTLITSRPSEHGAFFEEDLITKPISEVDDFVIGEEGYKLYTERLPKDGTAETTECFYSLFQKEIKKKVEIRTFYLKGKMFSMAIFSQADKQTSIDFRRYNRQMPNRNVPFKLPDNIQCRLVSLMEKLRLNSGSIDLILDEDLNYYFLEVNPVGQFGMVSQPCNYHLEELVALSLSGTPNIN